MTTRAAVLAFAAPLLLSAPALADHGRRDAPRSGASVTVSTGNGSLTIGSGGYGYTGYGYSTHSPAPRSYGRGYDRRLNQWGQDPREVRYLKRDAINQCAAKIERIGYRTGFRDVEIDNDLRVHQVGPRGFIIRFNDVEFEGRRREFERDVTCEVRRGDVVDLQGIPQPGQRGYSGDRGFSRSVSDHRGYQYGNRR